MKARKEMKNTISRQGNGKPTFIQKKMKKYKGTKKTTNPPRKRVNNLTRVFDRNVCQIICTQSTAR